jgi:hypothetical protein
MAEINLKATGYAVQRQPNELVAFDVRFVLLSSPNKSEEIAEALKKMELFLSKKINLVQAEDNKQRCFYCGVLNSLVNTTCSQCGAPL